MADGERSLIIDGTAVPRLLYGTAWKEDATGRLTTLAVEQGFRGIDTANQRRHYDEAAVGRAVADTIASGRLPRGELFLQTKFTFRSGQDHRLPYDPAAPVAMQVEQSFASSLEHLQTDVVDSYVLHGPTSRRGLSADDWAAWRAMETIHDSGRVRFLGVSNVTFEQLDLLCRGARVRPRFVQNRCFASQAWDKEIRQYCAANGMYYQGFSLLMLAHPGLERIAVRYRRTTPQIVFRFALDAGMIALTGTISAEHMRQDLDIFDFQLESEEIEQIEVLAAR
jgi:diketogulonate reductase-like aldo/keto reductase